MLLTSENLKLKKQIEEQRVIDAKDQQDYQKRILDEERRRQDILANIEASRKQREARKNEIVLNLQAEKDARIAELERIEEEHKVKNANLSEKDRQAAEAQFMAEKCRLESEFNEKMLKSQREAAPSESANSPAKIALTLETTQKNIRLVPQSVAKPVPQVEAASLQATRPVAVVE